MPIAAEWDPTTQTWIIAAAESFSWEDLVALMESTPWNGARRYLWDMSAMDSGPDSQDELRSAANLISKDIAGRAAIVVTRDFDFAIARMFQAFSEGGEVEFGIFRDREEAFEWLGAARRA